MLKYSIAALALVAGSSLAIADPNNGGPAGGGASMERPGGDMKPDRSSAAGERSSKMEKSPTSGEQRKSDRLQGMNEEHNAKDRHARALSQVDHSNALEIIWSVIPLVILIGLFSHF